MMQPHSITISQETIDRAKQVRLMVFDVDGVLTDGRIHVGPDGRETHKSFYVLDGAGIKMLQAVGIQVGIITGRSSSIVAERSRELGISYVLQGVKDKASALEQLCAAAQVTPQHVGYMGDDIIDLPAMRLAQFAATVRNAPPYVFEYAHWCSTLLGGRGAARECTDFILLAQGHLERLIEQGWH